KRFLNVAVFFERSASQNEINQTIESFESLEGVGKVVYISPESALEILKEEYPDLDKKQSPLPSSLRIEPKRPEAVSNIVAFAKQLPGIDYVEDTSKHADTYSDIIRIMLFVGVALLLIFLLAYVFSVSSSIGISVFSFRKEIKIMQLIGASPGYVRAPFLLIACISGLVSGVSNAFVMDAIVNYTYKFYQTFLFFSPIELNTVNLVSLVAFGLIIFGFVISFFSAIISLNRYTQ
ncbi:MAG: permease-like cell division protein FtsX, partial [Caldisericia bacterium]|nr:permease-like cell division protein FtsX [Caldisericia bacterium]